jgi:uncharacterized protein (DUF2062 family)
LIKIAEFFNRFLQIRDTPQKAALGLGLGVFLGVIPGAGIIAALIIASFLRFNRAASVLGVLITNTWLSVVTFLLSIKLGSAIMNLRWQEVYERWQEFFRNFHWSGIFKIPLLEILVPVALGYLIIAFALGFFTYLGALFVFHLIGQAKKR